MISEERWAEIRAIIDGQQTPDRRRRYAPPPASRAVDITPHRDLFDFVRRHQRPRTLSEVYDRVRQAMLPVLRAEARRLGLDGEYDDQGRWTWIHWDRPTPEQLEQVRSRLARTDVPAPTSDPSPGQPGS